MKTQYYRNAIGNLTPPPGYTQVAQEGETKTFNTPTNVAYGANGTFAYLNNVQGKITFSPSTFGYDPVRNVIKAGFAQTTLLLSDKALIIPATTSSTTSSPTPSATTDNNPALAPGSAVTSSSSSSTTKYIIIGAIGVVVIIGAFILLKHKKKH